MEGLDSAEGGGGGGGVAEHRRAGEVRVKVLQLGRGKRKSS